MMMKDKTLGLLLAAVLLSGCTGKAPQKNETEVSTKLAVQDNVVTMEELGYSTFSHEIISNGRVQASRYADMAFPSAGMISAVYVKNGSRVAKGQVIASLDMYALKFALKQATMSLDQAKLELQDFLIGQGYDPDKLQKVPAEMMRLARMKSGYDRSLSDIELAKYNISQAHLRAPFAGVVANVSAKANNMTSGTPVCRIIDTHAMEVEFTVLESELALIRVGDPISAKGFADDAHSITGRITEINPTVGEDGLVKVKARLNDDPLLINGMNLHVSIKKQLPKQLVVPKTAVTLRSGRKVVFTLDKDSCACWNYVQTGAENMNDYVVTEGLEPGMKVIVTGGRNLSHGTKVKVMADKR
jgi:membrane fusion protein (multidrug efflux system)